MLVDLDGTILDRRDLKVRDCVHPGSVINLTCSRVKVQGRLVVRNAQLFDKDVLVHFPVMPDPSHLLAATPIDPSLMAIMHLILSIWIFQIGRASCRERVCLYV